MKKIAPKDHNCHILLLVLLTLVNNVFMKLYNVSEVQENIGISCYLNKYKI